MDEIPTKTRNAKNIADVGRCWLTRRNGEMPKADRERFGRTGIAPGDRLVPNFLPREGENILVSLDQSCEGASPKRIKLTRFGVQPDGSDLRSVYWSNPLRDKGLPAMRQVQS
jgi:hypothetical protein